MSKDEEEDGEYSGLYLKGFPLLSSTLKMMTIFVGWSAVQHFDPGQYPALNILSNAFITKHDDFSTLQRVTETSICRALV